MSTATAIDLSQFDDDYRKQVGQTGAKPQTLPDGRYEVIVENVELTESKTSGQPMLKWTFRVTAPAAFVNRMLWKYKTISQKTMPFITEDLSTCGLQLDAFSDLPNRLGELLDVPLVVSKKTDGQWENVYLNKRPGQEPEKDDLPF